MQKKLLASRWAALLFIAICFAVASFGSLFTPGEWYQSLNRPPWTPPDKVFPIVWTLLYLMIGVAGWLVFRFGNTFLQGLWVVQLALNALWSWLFFGLHSPALGLLDIVLLLAVVAVLLWQTKQQQLNTVCWLLLPYLLWLVLATSLNAYIFLYN